MSRTPVISYRAVQRAGLHQSAVRCAGKESELGQDHRADTVEKVKQNSLNRQKEGKDEWHEELASDSESIVKADRGESEAAKQMHEQVEKGKKQRTEHEGTSFNKR
jgi:protein-tyrosine-phosphatase